MLEPTGRFTVSAMAPVPEPAELLAPPLKLVVQVAFVIPAGSGSDTVAPTTPLGPAFETTTLYTTADPGVYVAAPSVALMDRSAWLDWVSVSTALLLPGVGSVAPAGAVIVAAFTRSPV